MKLVFRGHDERYVVEQGMLNLFPGEKPVYEPSVRRTTPGRWSPWRRTPAVM